MTKAIIYSGFLRSWGIVKENHEQNIFPGDIFFYTHEKPKCEAKHVFKKIKSPLTEHSPALHLNAAGETSIINTLNQWRNRKAAFELVPDTYDVYAIARTDIRFSAPIDFNIQPGKIYIPIGNDHRDGINDQFAFGDYKSMKLYCNLYNHYRYYFNGGLIFHPETYLKHHLRDIEVIRIPQTNEIVR